MIDNRFLETEEHRAVCARNTDHYKLSSVTLGGWDNAQVALRKVHWENSPQPLTVVKGRLVDFLASFLRL